MAEMVEIPAGGTEALSDAYHRETSGLVYVIEGSLHLDAGGLHEVLEAGDCIFIESTMPLVWSAGAKQRCRVLAVRPVRNGK
jgi:quercetin dioxygenase-like cupin family protein